MNDNTDDEKGQTGKTLIRKAHPESRYVVILNKVAQDRSISYGARGLFADLMSRAGNWRIIPSQLETETAGSYKIARLLTDLEKAGLLVSTPLRNKKGQFCGYERILYSEPQTGYPVTAEPAMGEPATANSKQQKQYRAKDKKSKPTPPPEQKQQQGLLLPEWFDNLSEADSHALIDNLDGRHVELCEEYGVDVVLKTVRTALWEWDESDLTFDNIVARLSADRASDLDYVRAAIGGWSGDAVVEYGLSRVVECCKLAKERNAENLGGFVRKALSEGWGKVVEKKDWDDYDPERYFD